MKRTLIISVIIILAGIAWYGIAPIFMKTVVDEPLPMSTGAPTAPPSSEVTELRPAAAVTGTPGHPASGTARIVVDGAQEYLRYENFKTINGPDLRVYLATDTDAKDFVDLGPLRGTEGNINYSIPAGTDTAKYRYALTWCEDFAVLFNAADISSSR